jgi:hypothetical protein
MFNLVNIPFYKSEKENFTFDSKIFCKMSQLDFVVKPHFSLCFNFTNV